MMWKHTGNQRPEFAIEPGPGQESVWDYPRPPALVECDLWVEVKAGAQTIALSNRSMRVLETASPPTFYINPEDVNAQLLVVLRDMSYCEWKGTARYWGLADDRDAPPIGWSYPAPKPHFDGIRDWMSFYPGRLDCFVDGNPVRPQGGGFYGGWVTPEIVGPYKGEPGTSHW